MSVLKKLLAVVLLGVIAGSAYFVYQKIENPCADPVTYRIGSTDPKFGITQAELLADAQEAADIWNKQFGKTLLKYDPKGNVPINLIYDARQAAEDTDKTLSASLSTTQSNADQIKSSFEEVKSKYDAANVQYQTVSAAFQRDLDSYNTDVSYWNSQGGAPQSEYDTLSAEKARLQQEQATVQSDMETVNALAKQVNAGIDQYNALVANENADINTINQSADRQFEQGEYVSDATGQRINVYEYDSKDKLVRLLAHEMGHAMGLQHNTNPQSIMYYLNSATTLTLTKDDIAALDAVCRFK